MAMGGLIWATYSDHACEVMGERDARLPRLDEVVSMLPGKGKTQARSDKEKPDEQSPRRAMGHLYADKEKYN